MDIIVTTPKSQMVAAAQEAADCIAAGGGQYFRRFHPSYHPEIVPGHRLYYVEDGYVRGFAVVDAIRYSPHGERQTTGRDWPPGFYVYMNARSWRWIDPIPMRGFRGFRRADRFFYAHTVKIIGGWLDPKPEYNEMARKRITEAAPLFAQAEGAKEGRP